MSVLDLLIVLMVALPSAALAALAVPAWFSIPLSERLVARTSNTAFLLATLCGCAALVLVLVHGVGYHRTDLGKWFAVDHYAFAVTLVADHLSLPFAVFVVSLIGLISAFSGRYLHREPGFVRFHVMLTMFGSATVLVVLAGSLDLVFFGWELVGISSALLIAFFHERPGPVEHGMRAFVTYRLCDVGLLGALVWLHHATGDTVFTTGTAPWLGLPADTEVATGVSLLLLWASMGKSAQAPLGGWLPLAMEGPTPSSAIFYGSISVHLGAFLLLRASPLLAQSAFASGCVIAVGATTAIHASFVGRVQTDIKSTLAYASMTQIGLIFVEIGCGLHYLPLLHICGHATIRSLEILRSPSLLHDHRHLEQAVGRQVSRLPVHLERLFPARLRPWFYRMALERGYFDTMLFEWVFGPCRCLIQRLDRLDRLVTAKFSRLPASERQTDEEVR